MTPADFFRANLENARRVSARTGIDPRLVLAQTALETGYGKSAPNNNLFGIKGQGSTQRTKEFRNGQMQSESANFRSYEDPAQSFDDYADLMLGSERYAKVLGAKGLENQISAMAKSGYATDPNYGQKLMSIASGIDLNSAGTIADDTMRALGKSPKGILAPTQTSETETKPMMNQQKPRGLLENIGIQKMQEGAEGETGQRFYNRDSFKDTAATLAQGFGRMGIMGMEEIADQVAGQRTEAKARNKTMEAIGRMNTPQSKAALEYIQAGGDPISALKMAFEKPKPGFGAADVVAARKEFTSNQTVKKFQEQGSAYGRLLASVEDPSGAGDLALIFNYMKVLDPGSTVREGEFATAQNAGGIDDSVVGTYNSIVNGKLLSSDQRDDFANRATRLYADAEAEYINVSRQYEGFARKAGLPVDQVIPNFSYSGNRYESPLEFRRPPAPAGKDESEWSVAWANMTDKKRQEFIDARQ